MFHHWRSRRDELKIAWRLIAWTCDLDRQSSEGTTEIANEKTSAPAGRIVL